MSFFLLTLFQGDQWLRIRGFKNKAQAVDQQSPLLTIAQSWKRRPRRDDWTLNCSTQVILHYPALFHDQFHHKCVEISAIWRDRFEGH